MQHVTSSMSDTLLEEFEVLESIYPTELRRIADADVEIEAEADDLPDGEDNISITLCVHYPPSYPDELPVLSLKYSDESLDDSDEKVLLDQLKAIAEENIGMAMTFTLVSHLREHISILIRSKIEEAKRRDAEKARLELEEEERRTRGTPVTVESFRVWKAKFDKESAQKKAKEEEEKLRGLTPKEREEWKKSTTRLTGRQLFERNRNLEDETLVEEGAVSVDFSQYERTKEAEEEEEGLTFSDSD